jgi:hypothetical protein
MNNGAKRVYYARNQRNVPLEWYGLVVAESLCNDRLFLCSDSVPAPFDRCHAIPE